jgi:ubiquitin C-terminal hydrolase
MDTNRNTNIDMSTNTNTSRNTSTSTSSNTNTSTSTSSSSNTNTSRNTRTSSNTSTDMSMSTNTSTSTDMSTNTSTSTDMSTNTSTSTDMSMSTNTIISSLKIVGLTNRGNTCYLNTAIQCLYNISNLTEYFVSKTYIDDLKNRYIQIKKLNKPFNEILFSKEYSKLINAMFNCKDRIIEPKSIHEIIQKNNIFIGYEQQDAQEALAYILDQLHEGLKYEIDISYSGKIENEFDEIMVESIQNWKNNLGNNYSIVADLFFGQFINKVISLENDNLNETVSKTFEMFNMLNIPIYGRTIYDSLSKYFEKEILETKFFDEKNNRHMSVYKQIKLMKIPKYLIIVLKRYNNHISGNLYKSNNIISFPIDNLDISSYAEGYDSFCSRLKLISIGCHEGGLNGGHYYSICRTKDNKWNKFDDDDVQEFSIESNIMEIFKFGYILIYEKNE